MAVLALAGITGMYLRQVRQIGVLGLVGYLVAAGGYLVIMCSEVIGLVVLPAIAHSTPGYVNDILAIATGGSPTGDVGSFHDPQPARRLRLRRRRPPLRHRALPRERPRPLGLGAPRRQHGRHPRHPPAPPGQPAAVRHPRRHRARRPRLLAVARPAHVDGPATLAPASAQLDPAGAK